MTKTMPDHTTPEETSLLDEIQATVDQLTGIAETPVWDVATAAATLTRLCQRAEQAIDYSTGQIPGFADRRRSRWFPVAEAWIAVYHWDHYPDAMREHVELVRFRGDLAAMPTAHRELVQKAARDDLRLVSNAHRKVVRKIIRQTATALRRHRKRLQQPDSQRSPGAAPARRCGVTA